MNYIDNDKVYYDYGQFIHLNGITPEEIVENIRNAGTRKKTKITINGIVTKSENNEYNIVFTPTSTLHETITVSITINEVTETIEITPSDTEVVYGPVDKYCLANLDVSPYSSKRARYYTNFINENRNGLFDVILIESKDNKEKTLEIKQYKNNTNVEISSQIIEGYDFDKWVIQPDTVSIIENTDKKIIFVMPEEDVTVKCYFKQEVYTVTWKNEDGTVLEVDENVPYGSIPEYNGSTPTKEGDAQYTYTFKGWNKEINSITGNTTYIATYTSIIKSYTITWKNEDGTVLETDKNVPYGTTPEYNGPIPTKQGDAQYTYEFSGWDKVFESVTEDIIYTATYNGVVKQYTLNVEVINGTSNIENGTKFDYGTNIEVKLTANEGYSVNGGYDRETVVIKNVTIEEDTTINHEFMINMYDITFVDHDDNSIETLNINYNETLVVPSDIEPSDYEDDQYVWKFNGSWNPEINENTKVLGDQIYKAQYSSELRTFELIIKVENGTYNISSRDGNETYTYGEVVEVTIIPNEGYSINGKPTETYEVVITEDTELTYTCDLITYKLTVNDEFIGDFEPNADISSYLTYIEQENKTHKWMEGDIEFTETVMPHRNLTLTSVYIDI